ncbi:LysE/ArgO family amino acid transporter [Variovorax sp. LjRoot290]|uniref:LysE/ArgO family amino acid transporter n=1 Tax=unclassified Variovorax TaxID=663243 RepID=UPI0008903231|nr:LysE/ArgO family amino acid transporter [Variovorax sp. CF079]SDD84154.1 L-lysine exporter family protein LysE/ArgO [Variovorax sp. CF079]
MTPFAFPAFATGFGLTLGLIVAIGAQNAFVLRQGLRREHVWPVILFCALADTVLVAVGVVGMGQVLDRLPLVAPALTVGGALFLLVYAAFAWRRALRPAALHAAAGGAGRNSLRRVMTQTAAFTLLNPHVYVDTLLLVGAVGAQQAGLGKGAFVAGTALASASWFAGLGAGARLLAPLFAKPVAWRWLDALVGLVMLVLGVVLAGQAVSALRG